MRKFNIGILAAFVIGLAVAGCTGLDNLLYTTPTTQVSVVPANSTALTASQIATIVAGTVQTTFTQLQATAPTTQSAQTDAKIAGVANTVQSLGTLLNSYLQNQTTVQSQSTAQLTNLGQAVSLLTGLAQAGGSATAGTPWGIALTALAAIGGLILQHNKSSSTASAVAATTSAQATAATAAHATTLQTLLTTVANLTTAIQPILTALQSPASVAPQPVTVTVNNPPVEPVAAIPATSPAQPTVVPIVPIAPAVKPAV